MKKLLTVHMESVEQAKYRESRAVLDVWIGWPEARLGLKKPDEKEAQLTRILNATD